LLAIKNVGVKMVNDIVAERERNGEFKDFVDFCNRMAGMDLNSRAVDSMIKCGVFDCFKYSRRHLAMVQEPLLNSIAAEKKNQVDGQIGLFAVLDQQVDVGSQFFKEPQEEFEKTVKMAFEKELIGIHLTDNPFEPYRHIYNRRDITTIAVALSEDFEDGKEIWSFAQIDHFKTLKTKAGKEMGYLSISDISGGMECVLFPNVYARLRSDLTKGALVFLRGKVQQDEVRGTKLLVEEIRYPSEKDLAQNIKRLYLKLPSREDALTGKVLDVLKRHSGIQECILYFEDSKKSVSTLNSFGISIDDNLVEDLKELLKSTDIVIK
jgi:DNA polymerase-3 subunit alpha